jgi:hypothetical protein
VPPPATLTPPRPGAERSLEPRSTPRLNSLAPLPAPQDIEEKQVQPELYPYGSRGPLGAHYLAAKHGVRWGDLADEDM